MRASAWESLLQYLLAVNSQVAKIRKVAREETTEDYDTDNKPDPKAPVSSFEDINVQTIVLNELNIGSDHIYLPYRAIQFLKSLIEHDQLGEFAVEYLAEKYDFDYRRFIFEITSLYMGNNPNKQNSIKNAEIGFEIDTTFIYYPKDDTIKLFKELSQRYQSNNPEKLLSIRKYPFYNNNDKAFF